LPPVGKGIEEEADVDGTKSAPAAVSAAAKAGLKKPPRPVSVAAAAAAAARVETVYPTLPADARRPATGSLAAEGDRDRDGDWAGGDGDRD